MKFNYKCDGMDGLVLIDEKSISEMNDVLLNELDIFLDRYGKSELIYDFPDEKWEDVWKRETKKLLDFCNSGKMVLFLTYEDQENCEIKISDMPNDAESFIEIDSGKLILINASELIQCAAYPELEMETVLEINNLDKGTYVIKYEAFLLSNK